MNKLAKKQLKQRQDLSAQMEAAKEELEAAVETYNGAMSEAWEKVSEALNRLNETITAADEFRSEIESEQEEYYDERSERWQEGDAGQAYQAWKEDWGTELSEVEMEKPDDLEMPDVEAVENFEMLNEEP